ncbi:MAG: 9-O-acetylesterase, partial [Lentisphaeria bacterium]|nr:9-O-acetylesterase [Lentisphaeria bacterium]
TAKIIADYSKWLNEYKAAVAAGQLPPEPPVFPASLKHYVIAQQPTVKYNSMIHPPLPFAFRGVIWYQGCSNRYDGMLYKSKMHALLNGWRQLFQQPDMAFYFVQLSPYRYGGNPYALPVIWEAQQAFADCMPENVAMAVINDVGDYGDIHPHDKLTVGNRLGLLALKHTYNKNIKADSPILKSWKIEGNKFILEFKNVEKFVSKGKIANFEVAGDAENWQKADVAADGNKLVVSSANVPEPYKLRYMWHQTLTGNLYNEAGLPLGAFRCGKEVPQEAVIKDIEKNMQLIYQHDPRKATGDDGSIKYQIDNSGKFNGKVKRIAYSWEIVSKAGKKEYVVAVMDAFTKDVKKIGVPVAAAKAQFAVKVQNVSVYSNVEGLATGNIGECNIEFWSKNYVPGNTGAIPGANARKYDSSDTPQGAALGYGCMQLHNFKANQTVFAYNSFRNTTPDLGFGNSTHRADATDWTFARNAAGYKIACLKVYACFE